ncbi:YciI family protein [Microbacterium sp. HJ5]
MAQWLYRVVPVRADMVGSPTEAEQRIVAEHFGYLTELRDRGVLILAGRTQEQAGTFGITIFEAPDDAAARAVMDADPAVAAGVFAATLHPYAVAVARRGWTI